MRNILRAALVLFTAQLAGAVPHFALLSGFVGGMTDTLQSLVLPPWSTWRKLAAAASAPSRLQAAAATAAAAAAALTVGGKAVRLVAAMYRPCSAGGKAASMREGSVRSRGTTVRSGRRVENRWSSSRAQGSPCRVRFSSSSPPPATWRRFSPFLGTRIRAMGNKATAGRDAQCRQSSGRGSKRKIPLLGSVACSSPCAPTVLESKLGAAKLDLQELVKSRRRLQMVPLQEN